MKSNIIVFFVLLSVLSISCNHPRNLVTDDAIAAKMKADSTRMADSTAKANKLEGLYYELKSNHTILGLPANYDVFAQEMGDPKVSLSFYNLAKQNPTIKGLGSDYFTFALNLGIPVIYEGQKIDRDKSKTEYSQFSVYNALTKEYNLGSFDDFKKNMKNANIARTVYDSASKYYDLGNFNIFARKMGLHLPLIDWNKDISGDERLKLFYLAVQPLSDDSLPANYGDFEQYMQDPAKAIALQKVLIKDSFTDVPKDYYTFAKKLGLVWYKRGIYGQTILNWIFILIGTVASLAVIIMLFIKLAPKIKNMIKLSPYLRKNMLLKVALGLFVILIFTNPSMKQFKEYTGGDTGRRTSNWLIFSIYQRGDHSYFAIFNNFYEMD